MSSLQRRLLRLFRRKRVEADMHEELHIHVALETEHLMQSEGLGAPEARRRALVAFGGVERMTERARDVRRPRWLEDLVKDCRLGLRALRRTPGFSAVAVLTLTLGVGATTAMFSVVNSVLLSPLPYPESDRLVAVWSRFLPESGFDFPESPLSPPEYFDYRAQTRTLADVAALSGMRATLIGNDGDGISVRAAQATSNLFDVLRVSPAHGRTWTVDEDVADGARVAVIGHALWQRVFGGTADILGRTISVNGTPAQVIGVMPERFAYPAPEYELWLPAGLDPAVDTERAAHYLTVVGRMRDGVDAEQAHREMSALMERWRLEYPAMHTGHFLFLQPLLDNVVGTARPALLVLLGAVGFVLLIVCTNVANLLLARGEARRRELALRSALGAGRSRLVRQFLAEGAVLSFIGGVAGVALAHLLLRATLALGSASIPRVETVQLDGRALLFTAAISVFTTFVFALAPLTGLAAASPRTELGDAGRTTGSARGLRLRRTLVTVQVALAVIVVIGAGLMVRSFDALTAVDRGFAAHDGVLVTELALPAGSYADEAAVVTFYDQLSERLAALPGVQQVGITGTLPLGNSVSNIDFEIEGSAPPAPGQPAHSGDIIITDPGFPAAFDVDIVDGRFFEPSDRDGTLPVAVVNQRLAQMFWPGESATGKRLRLATDEDVPWLHVVGVIDDVKFREASDEARPAWYVPMAQMATSGIGAGRRFHVAVRSTRAATTLGADVRSVVRTLDATLPIIRMRPLETIVSDAVAAPRFTMSVLSLFALLALVLGAIGIYGVLAYAVARRTKEFGIRIALGADWRSLTTIVLGEGLTMVGIGLAIGLLGALATTRLIDGLVFGVSTTDPATFIAVAAAVCVTTLAASVAPLWRSLRSDPVKALRAE
jgi:putative ABC transport system permease protein